MGLDFNVSLEPSEKAVAGFKAESKRAGPDKWLACIRELNNALEALVSDAGLASGFDPGFFSDLTLRMRHTEDMLKSFCENEWPSVLPGEANRLLTSYVTRVKARVSDSYLAATTVGNETLAEMLAKAKQRIMDAVREFEKVKGE